MLLRNQMDRFWIRLNKPTATVGTKLYEFGDDIAGDVTADGSRIATFNAHVPQGYAVRDAAGTELGGLLVGLRFGWNPSGTLGAHSSDETGLHIVTHDAAPAPDLPTTATLHGYSQPIPLTSLEFYGWINDTSIMVTAKNPSGTYVLTLADNSLSLAPLDVENPNYPKFDPMGTGTFVNGPRVQHLDSDSGSITTVGNISPAPATDYIAESVSWSPSAKQFTVDLQGHSGTELCTIDTGVSCVQIPLPTGFQSEGGKFSLDGTQLAINGYIQTGSSSAAVPWHPLLVSLPSLSVSPLRYACTGTCYVYAYVGKPDAPEIETGD